MIPCTHVWELCLGLPFPEGRRPAEKQPFIWHQGSSVGGGVKVDIVLGGLRELAQRSGESQDHSVNAGSPVKSRFLTQSPYSCFLCPLQFKRLQGKRNRGREEVNFVEIKGDDQLSGAQQWMTKSLTEEKTMKSFSKVSGKLCCVAPKQNLGLVLS